MQPPSKESTLAWLFAIGLAIAIIALACWAGTYAPIRSL